MSTISEQIKELREEAEYQKDIKDYHEMDELLSEAANTIESLSEKLQAEDGEYETILQEIREKVFCVEAGEYYSDSVVSYDDVEEIIRSHMKGGNDGENKD